MLSIRILTYKCNIQPVLTSCLKDNQDELKVSQTLAAEEIRGEFQWKRFSSAAHRFALN